jgi:hypothetical protein
MVGLPNPLLDSDQFSNYDIEKFRPRPALSWGASWSQFANGIIDWFGYYRSNVGDISMHLDNKAAGFKQAEKYIDSIKAAGQFFKHPYHYRYDKLPEDEWRTPKEFFYFRWADVTDEYWMWPEDIADDCEGTAWFAHHCIRVANKVSVDDIKKDFQNGKRNNVIGCCYDDESGHAYNVHGQWTVGNWGRIDHGNNDPAVIAKDFISDSNWISFYVENEAGDDIEYLEGAEINYYKNIKRTSVKEHMAIMAENDEKIKYGMVTGEHMDEICSEIRKVGDVLQVPEKIFEKYGLPTEPIKRGLAAEINGRGPIVKKIAKQLDVPIKKVLPLEVKFVA